MSDTKIFSLGDQSGLGGGGMASLIASLCQNRGLDPNMVAAMMNNNRGGCGWGDMGAWWIVILLIFGWGGFGNGFGGGFNGRGTAQGLADLGSLVNNDAGRELLMSAIQGNGTAISQLASTVHCDVNALQGSIANLSTQLGQLGLGQRDIIAAMNSGNTAIMSKLCDCCCESRLAICQQTNTLQGAINGVNSGVERGFSALGYALADQGCQSRQNANDNTRAILAKLDAMEDSRKDREIAALTAQLTAANSRAERQAELAPIYKQLSDIACKQMPTFPMPYCPASGSYVPVNYGITVNPLASPQCGGCC